MGLAGCPVREGELGLGGMSFEMNSWQNDTPPSRVLSLVLSGLERRAARRSFQRDHLPKRCLSGRWDGVLRGSACSLSRVGLESEADRWIKSKGATICCRFG